LNIFDICNLSQTIAEPTRITNTSHSNIHRSMYYQ
jgi:hypothetical protein